MDAWREVPQPHPSDASHAVLLPPHAPAEGRELTVSDSSLLSFFPSEAMSVVERSEEPGSDTDCRNAQHADRKTPFDTDQNHTPTEQRLLSVNAAIEAPAREGDTLQAPTNTVAHERSQAHEVSETARIIDGPPSMPFQAIEQLDARTTEQLQHVTKMKAVFRETVARFAGDGRPPSPIDARIDSVPPDPVRPRPAQARAAIPRGWSRPIRISAAVIAGVLVLAALSGPLLRPVGGPEIVVTPPVPSIPWPAAAATAARDSRMLRTPPNRMAGPPPRRGRGPQPPLGTGRFNGTLAIASVPSGASVFVNHRLVGLTPLQLRLPATSYAVWVEREGYQRWTAGVSVPADKLTRVAMKLESERAAAAGSAANIQP